MHYSGFSMSLSERKLQNAVMIEYKLTMHVDVISIRNASFNEFCSPFKAIDSNRAAIRLFAPSKSANSNNPASRLNILGFKEAVE